MQIFYHKVVTMSEGHKVPHHGEHQPRDVEGGAEAEDGLGPGQVNHWGEEVFQVSAIITTSLAKGSHTKNYKILAIVWNGGGGGGQQWSKLFFKVMG